MGKSCKIRQDNPLLVPHRDICRYTTAKRIVQRTDNSSTNTNNNGVSESSADCRVWLLQEECPAIPLHHTPRVSHHWRCCTAMCLMIECRYHHRPVTNHPLLGRTSTWGQRPGSLNEFVQSLPVSNRDAAAPAHHLPNKAVNLHLNGTWSLATHCCPLHRQYLWGGGSHRLIWTGFTGFRCIFLLCLSSCLWPPRRHSWWPLTIIIQGLRRILPSFEHQSLLSNSFWRIIQQPHTRTRTLLVSTKWCPWMNGI